MVMLVRNVAVGLRHDVDFSVLDDFAALKTFPQLRLNAVAAHALRDGLFDSRLLQVVVLDLEVAQVRAAREVHKRRVLLLYLLHDVDSFIC